MASSEDPGGMPTYLAFHPGLYCLLRFAKMKQSSGADSKFDRQPLKIQNGLFHILINMYEIRKQVLYFYVF